MGRVFLPKAKASPEDVATLFLHVWRVVLQRSHFTAGCAVVAVTVAADSSELLAHVGAIFHAWRRRLADLLVQGGVDPNDAMKFGTTLIAASEGAVILSRAEQSMEPFELVAAQLLEQACALPRVVAPRNSGLRKSRS
jgi:TetR/AcrR family transcriptional repressor of lmrAB and yxaGH operons